MKMFDGMKLETEILDYESWKNSTKIPWFTKVQTDTGTIDSDIRISKGWQVSSTLETATMGEYYLELKKVLRVNPSTLTRNKDYYFKLRGSMHKNYYGENYSPFLWCHLQSEISELIENFGLNPDEVKISNLEVGVNIIIPYDISSFINKCIIAYKGKAFNRYDPKNGSSLGIYCHQSQSIIKIYSKKDQYDLPTNVIRFEIAFKKMQVLNKLGISKLSDLMDEEKVKALGNLLLKAWDSIIIYDPSIDLKDADLSVAEGILLLKGSNPKFWEELKNINKNAYNNTRTAYKRIMAKHGYKTHERIKSLIEEEWEWLFN